MYNVIAFKFKKHVPNRMMQFRFENTKISTWIQRFTLNWTFAPELRLIRGGQCMSRKSLKRNLPITSSSESLGASGILKKKPAILLSKHRICKRARVRVGICEQWSSSWSKISHASAMRQSLFASPAVRRRAPTSSHADT